MGKGGGGELWDDSALIKAFDSAISSYKAMHRVTDSKTDLTTLPIDQTSERVHDDSARIGDSDDHSQVLENAIDSLNEQNDSLPPNSSGVADQSGQPEKHVVASDINNQNGYMLNPNEQEEYNQLWNKYYEIEEQRQKIMEQLNQYGDWNYQTYATNNTNPSEERKEYVPQPYETVTCHCPYGCQNLILPCTSAPSSCLGGKCANKDCTVISEYVGGTSLPKEDPDIVKTAMDAAEKALSSLMKEDNNRADTSENGGKNNELGVERDQAADSDNSVTDLSMVLKAWYSAGFYTGKYLSEQSFEKKRHC